MSGATFADKLRAALTDLPFPVEIEEPPADAQPTFMHVDIRRAPSFVWEHEIERSADGRITKMVSRAVKQVQWTQVVEQ